MPSLFAMEGFGRGLEMASCQMVEAWRLGAGVDLKAMFNLEMQYCGVWSFPWNMSRAEIAHRYGMRNEEGKIQVMALS